MRNILRDETQVFARIILEESTLNEYGTGIDSELLTHMSGRRVHMTPRLEKFLTGVLSRLPELSVCPACDIDDNDPQKYYTLKNLFPEAAELLDTRVAEAEAEAESVAGL